MSNEKFTKKLATYHKVLLQFPRGTTALELAEKLGIHRTAVYDFLNSMESRGLARNEHGLWFAREPELEKPYDDRVEKAMLKLAEEQNKTTMEEVASEVGLPPSSIEPAVYRMVGKHKWKTRRTKLDEVEIDFNHPFDPNTIRLGPVNDPWRPYDKK